MQWAKPDHQYRVRLPSGDGYVYYKIYNDARRAKNHHIKKDASYQYLIEHRGTYKMRVFVDDPVPQAVQAIFRFYSPDARQDQGAWYVTIEVASLDLFRAALAAHCVYAEVV
jgi:hypothetical protein